MDRGMLGCKDELIMDKGKDGKINGWTAEWDNEGRKDEGIKVGMDKWMEYGMMDERKMDSRGKKN